MDFAKQDLVSLWPFMQAGSISLPQIKSEQANEHYTEHSTLPASQFSSSYVDRGP